MPTVVQAARDALADALPGDVQRFDCALANLYPAGEGAVRPGVGSLPRRASRSLPPLRATPRSQACKFHSDPEHGSYWHRDTAVVSLGEVRRFAFRRIDGDERHTFHLFHGDVVEMRRDCQDAYQHAVLAAEGEANDGARVSLVFKKAIPHGPSGRLGHGVPGSGATRAEKRRGATKPKIAVKKPGARRRQRKAARVR